MIVALASGKVAGANPWHSMGYEWTKTQSPPVTHNFVDQPTYPNAPHDYTVEGAQQEVTHAA
jgi:cytochrome c oxidase subunit 1